MGTKRKAEEQEVFEIESDEEGEVQEEQVGADQNDGGDGSDSDVEIQEKSIPVVNLDDDEEMDGVPGEKEPPDEPDSKKEFGLTDSPASPTVTETFIGPAPRSEGCKEAQEEAQQAGEMVEVDSNKLLLSMTFRDAELFQLFKGSLTEYLKTTFQLKLAGQEVDVLHQVESCSIQILSKQPLPAKVPAPTVCPPATPAPKDNPAKAAEVVDDGMFVIDSTPAKTAKGGPIVPSYKKALQKVLDNSPTANLGDSATKRPKPRQLCWNCDGDHGLRDCKEPRNFAKISKMKQEHMKKMDRYHVDLEQKYGHIVPGRLSDELRQALGLKKRDLPVHIYRMRLYGYPPGWLEEAKITHSGLQLFDSRGDPVLDSDESDGEVDNVKHKFDVRKIISYPGFNVPAGSEFYDDSKFFGVPPLQEHQSRERMIQSLEGSLVQGYRRKKLRLSGVGASEGPQAAADMELDAPDEGSFTTVDSVGECDSLKGHEVNGEPVVATAANRPTDEEPEEGEVDEDGDELKRPEEVVPEKVQLNGKEDDVESTDKNDNDTSKDDSLILVEPEEPEIICLDDTRPPSPTLEDLRRQQQQLLQQLEDQSPAIKRRKKGSLDSTKSPEDSLLEDVLEVERLAEQQQEDEPAPNPAGQFVPFVFPVPPLPPPNEPSPPQERPPEPEFLNLDEIKMSKTPFIDDPATMGLKTMSLGTPILTAFSPFNTLPCGDAFSKGVSDVINFENLPNSTGKYERMKSLLSKVRTVITAHNGELDGEEEGEEEQQGQDQDSR